MNGALAEQKACKALQAAGLQLLKANFRCRLGELDLIMAEGDTVVFVEVRARRSGSRVSAVESVGPAKQSKLLAAARFWLAAHPQSADKPLRFDLVSFDGEDMRWQRNVLQCDG